MIKIAMSVKPNLAVRVVLDVPGGKGYYHRSSLESNRMLHSRLLSQIVGLGLVSEFPKYGSEHYTVL